MHKVVTRHTNPNDEDAKIADLWWHVQRIRYWGAPTPWGLAFLVGVVGGFLVAFALIWSVFHYGVSEERLRFWVSGCVACGLAAGGIIYQLLFPFGSCWAWFGC